MADVTKEQDIWVHSFRMPPDSNNSIKMEVGIEDCLHIEFEYNKSKYVAVRFISVTFSQVTSTDIIWKMLLLGRYTSFWSASKLSIWSYRSSDARQRGHHRTSITRARRSRSSRSWTGRPCEVKRFFLYTNPTCHEFFYHNRRNNTYPTFPWRFRSDADIPWCQQKVQHAILSQSSSYRRRESPLLQATGLFLLLIRDRSSNRTLHRRLLCSVYQK